MSASNADCLVGSPSRVFRRELLGKGAWLMGEDRSAGHLYDPHELRAAVEAGDLYGEGGSF
jgi:hypothetical protein